ncbi:hypothetical protein ACFVMC_29370 [Nocardia sp. NPDC127579]|uniref:hypothetical protein n=1 Tax=Nocardia sp. NPDC127579 TaxID=3345402 RepID=UPI00363F779E
MSGLFGFEASDLIAGAGSVIGGALGAAGGPGGVIVGSMVGGALAGGITELIQTHSWDAAWEAAGISAVFGALPGGVMGRVVGGRILGGELVRGAATSTIAGAASAVRNRLAVHTGQGAALGTVLANRFVQPPSSNPSEIPIDKAEKLMKWSERA